jgi:hypothetical protein
MQHNEINDQYNKLDRLVDKACASIFDAFVFLNEVLPVVKLYKQDA